MAGPLPVVNATLLPQKPGSTVQITGAPADIEADFPVVDVKDNKQDAFPVVDVKEQQGAEEFPVVDVEKKTPFKYQEDPEIQRISGTPEERKQKSIFGGLDTTSNVEAREIPFKDLYTKPENLKVIKDYAEARYGESGKQKKDETDEDYAKRWMTSMRQVEWNTTINAIPELTWLDNAKKDDVLKAARAHNLFNSVPSWYSKGGQPGVRPFAEAFFSAATEPTNIASFGVGAGVRYAMASQAIKNVLSSKLKAMGVGAAIETGLGVYQSAKDQDIKRQTGVQRDQWDKVQFGISALLGTLSGAADVASTVAKPIKLSADRFEAELAGRRVPVKEDEQLAKIKELFSKSQADLDKNFDIFEGRKVLNALSPETELTQSSIREDINKKALEVAMYVMYREPQYLPKEGQRVSQAVQNVVANLDTLDVNVFEDALARANISSTDFANSILTTASDSGKVLNSYSQLKKVINKLSEIDPEAKAKLDAIAAADEGVTTLLGSFINGVRRLERESKAIVVSGLGTTARNILGTGVGLTFDAGAKLVENTLYAGGKALNALATGNISAEATGRGLVNVIRDSFATLGYLSDAGLTKETVDALLKRNPSLQKQIFTALQESGTQELSTLAKTVNTLNVAQDVFFRRAIFASSVDRQLKRIGLDVKDVLANDKVIPVDILKTATDETLKATFSYVPKQQKAGKKTLEATSETIASKFVDFFEKLPSGSLWVTFPRFMANAVAFQYRYSPFGASSGLSDIARGAKRLNTESIDDEVGQALIEKGMTKFARGVTGTAAIYAAYKYRMENQDSEWYNYKRDDGGTVDLRGVFPIGPYMAVGDYIAKQKLGRTEDAKFGELAEAIVGMKMPAGTQASMLDELPNIIAGTEGKATERAGKAIGRIVGDFAGRFTTPAKALFEYFDAFDKESQIARDPNIVEGQGEFWKSAQQAAVQRVMAKIPGLKEKLPEFQPYFSEKAPVRAGEFFNSLSGVRVTPQKNEIEREFVKLKLDPYAFFGSTGDKVYDRAFIKTSVPYVENRITGLIKSDRYQGYTLDQKRMAMATNLQETLGMAREITQAKMTASDRDRVNTMKFNKLPAVARRAINELYANDHGGESMDKAKDYGQVYKYEALIQQFR
jgi:hypothetical protein